jgi:hypothetical protein
MSKDQGNDHTPVIFESKIPKLKKKYYFHELIKESPMTKHYIVEDLDVEIAES